MRGGGDMALGEPFGLGVPKGPGVDTLGDTPGISAISRLLLNCGEYGERPRIEPTEEMGRNSICCPPGDSVSTISGVPSSDGAVGITVGLDERPPLNSPVAQATGPEITRPGKVGFGKGCSSPGTSSP